MELLYLVDRTVTNFIQSFSRLMFRVTRIPTSWQSLFLLFPSVGIQQLSGSLLNLGSTNNRVWGTFLVFGYLGLLIISRFIGYFLGRLLELAHSFIDHERFYGSKDFSCGHLAWGQVIFSVVLLCYALLDKSSPLAFYSWELGFFAIVPNAYGEFATRRKFDNNKKKQTASETLRKLVERCQSWLPKPTPIPS